MITIVAGLPRSGTSAMMKALQAGGMRVEWSRKRDNAIDAKGSTDDYTVNDTYYEIDFDEYDDLDFPSPKYDGAAIKVIAMPKLNGLQRIRKCDHRIIWMQRDPVEIVESFTRSFGGGFPVKWNGVWVRSDRLSEADLRKWHGDFTRRTLEVATSRLDCNLVFVNYADLCESPRTLLATEFLDLPIDVEAAAAVINSEKRRVVHS